MADDTAANAGGANAGGANAGAPGVGGAGDAAAGAPSGGGAVNAAAGAPNVAGGNAGAPNVGGAGGGDAGAPNLGGGGSADAGAAGAAGCADGNLFADQTVIRIGSQRRFYSWTTDAQISELRAGGPLFSRSESPGKGRGLAMTRLAEFASAGATPEQMLAGQLASTTFAKLRFSWPNPWATLMGWPGETYGNQLLEIELQPEAWIVTFDRRGLAVYDAQSQPVAIQTALASPERIGAIYFQSNDSTAVNGTYCGTFSQGAVAFREFVLGNLNMVQRWSLATPEIRRRLDADIASLNAFKSELACLGVPEQPAWSSALICSLGSAYEAPSGSLQNYDFSLGIPSELYWPSPDNIDALVAALAVSLPTGAPLVVTPGG